MKRLVLASCVALLVLAPILAAAQERPAPASGGSSAGSASPRGGESSGGSSMSSSGSSGSATDRGSMGGMGSGSFSSPVAGSSLRGSYAGPRSGESIGFAQPRNGSSSVGQPVPVSERARGDRPVYGHAIPRSEVPNNPVVINRPYYYDPYGLYGFYGYPGYNGFYGYYSPYYWDAWTMPFGYGMYAWPLTAYSNYWAGSAAPAYTTPTTGSIKLKVKPKEAEVYVDGTFYGPVDRYDGTFQHLDLPAGTHVVEVRAAGYETLKIEIRVLPGKTTTYTGDLKAAK